MHDTLFLVLLVGSVVCIFLSLWFRDERAPLIWPLTAGICSLLNLAHTTGTLAKFMRIVHHYL